jgi:hypothetical protein
MANDQSHPIIDDIRMVQHRISARFDNYPARLLAYYHDAARGASGTADRFFEGSRTHEPVGRLQLGPALGDEESSRRRAVGICLTASKEE